MWLCCSTTQEMKCFTKADLRLIVATHLDIRTWIFGRSFFFLRLEVPTRLGFLSHCWHHKGPAHNSLGFATVATLHNIQTLGWKVKKKKKKTDFMAFFFSRTLKLHNVCLPNGPLSGGKASLREKMRENDWNADASTRLKKKKSICGRQMSQSRAADWTWTKYLFHWIMIKIHICVFIYSYIERTKM